MKIIKTNILIVVLVIMTNIQCNNGKKTPKKHLNQNKILNNNKCDSLKKKRTKKVKQKKKYTRKVKIMIN